MSFVEIKLADNFIKDVIKDYDNDFDKAMEEMEKETSS